MMQEMYQQFLDEDDAWKKVAKDQVRKILSWWYDSKVGDMIRKLVIQIQIKIISPTLKYYHNFRKKIFFVGYKVGYVNFLSWWYDSKVGDKDSDKGHITNIEMLPLTFETKYFFVGDKFGFADILS